MLDLKAMEKSELVDLLAKETVRYYKMSKMGAEKEKYDDCKATIKEIHLEIERRKNEKKSL